LEPAYAYFKENGNLFIDAKGLAEAKLALRDMRAMKKALALSKRQVTQQQQLIRAQYTYLIRQRGHKVVGGGSVGRAIRWGQTRDRSNLRRQLADVLAPLEEQK